ncbi:MAG TPA: C1 family peptidase [Acetobacteraceae bacterium]|jgi:C1A family cysteine protease|nr:C1 family peptidase [Acetobacteraceae bacterium]
MSGTTNPEVHRICNLVPSRGTETDWRFEHAVASGALAAATAMPAGVDLRAAWWKIGDQGRTGSCVGWATADGLLRYHMVKAGRLGQSELLSPRYCWMASKETDEITTRPETFIEGAGTSLKAAVEVMRKYGAAPEALLPFDIENTMYLDDENTFYAIAAKRRVVSYFNLQKNLAQWRTWLATHGPLLVGLSVDASWDSATKTHGNIDNFQSGTVRGGHAVCVVGYTAQNRFIVRNSWGTAWGDKGFGYVSEAYIQAAFFNESYGVTV